MNQKTENLKITIGSVVKFHDEMFLLWGINEFGSARLLRRDGTKHCEMPKLDELEWLYQVPVVRWKNRNYIVDKRNRIFSLFSGNITYISGPSHEKLIRDASCSPISEIHNRYIKGYLTFRNFYNETVSALHDYNVCNYEKDKQILY